MKQHHVLADLSEPREYSGMDSENQRKNTEETHLSERRSKEGHECAIHILGAKDIFSGIDCKDILNRKT